MLTPSALLALDAAVILIGPQYPKGFGEVVTCIDLIKRYGDRFRVAHDPSYYAECGDAGRTHDPWLLTILCEHGHIYPHGGDVLGASTTHRGPVANRLVALPFVRVVQDGDDGVNVVFAAADFDAVADVMRPRRRRRLSPAQRDMQVDRLREYRFTTAAHGPGSDRRRDPSAGDGRAVDQPAGDDMKAAPHVRA